MNGGNLYSTSQYGENDDAQQETGHNSRSCPCKRIPLNFSSFTAAEQGNLAALLSRQQRHCGDGGNMDWAQCQDSAGNTPLHLAAQHGHTAVTALLLNASNNNNNNSSLLVNAAAGGATPLHRAAYSGAVATMRLLLAVPTCDVMARDTSFGDDQTPLHKACSGGRYLAVQLLLEVFLTAAVVPSEPTTTTTTTLLEKALQMRDARGLTPLQVAREKQQHREEERGSVARWESVAGGVADWQTCIRLLEAREVALPPSILTTPSTQEMTMDRRLLTGRQPWLRQEEEQQQQQQQRDCECADGYGKCLTAPWEQAFRAALRTKVDNAISLSAPVPNTRNDSSCVSGRGKMVISTDDFENTEQSLSENRLEMAATKAAPLDNQPNHDQQNNVPSTDSQQRATPPILPGLHCDSCAQPSIVVYPSEGEQLVCKKCRQMRKLTRPVVAQ